MTKEVGDRLGEILRQRKDDSDFLFASPKCMWKLEDFQGERIGDKIDGWLARHGLDSQLFFERDMITDELAEHAGLAPLIEALNTRRVIVIGNKYLEDLEFLNYWGHIEIPSPNYHLELDGPAGLSRVHHVLRHLTLQPLMFVVSAGMSAAILIDHLYDLYPRSSFMDCGSIWDAFVGIGCQREWRRRLYADPTELIEWKRKNGVFS
jgi:hypothetical protein